MLDLYHAQIGEGNLIELVRRAGPLIGEIQVADVPGRCEPGTGEISYPAIAAALADLGYAGTVGLEPGPPTATASAPWPGSGPPSRPGPGRERRSGCVTSSGAQRMYSASASHMVNLAFASEACLRGRPARIGVARLRWRGVDLRKAFGAVPAWRARSSQDARERPEG